MKILKSYSEFLNEKINEKENDLFKVYLAIDPDSGHRWWSYKGFAADNFFIQINKDNYKDIDINPNYPILTYNSGVVETLLKENLIKKENIYNRPEFIKQSGSKAEFHKIVDGDESIPKTCHSEEEALALIVNGFFEPFTRELPMEYAVELNKLMALEMEGSIG